MSHIEYLKKGKLHKDDGPAVIYDTGYQAWYQEGLLHREDGPAVIHPNGHQEYWLLGCRLQEQNTFFFENERYLGFSKYNYLASLFMKEYGWQQWLKGFELCFNTLTHNFVYRVIYKNRPTHSYVPLQFHGIDIILKETFGS